jgi:acyl transferase domain-containing protein
MQDLKLSPIKQALLAFEEMRAKVESLERCQSEPIAVIGLACRFPGAPDAGSFWSMLRDGRDAVSEVPISRWDSEALYDPDPDVAGKTATKWGGFLDQVDEFDPEFFGISPREAVAMDPQQRLLLEVAWEALENAGQGPRRLAACPTGVFIGITGDEYAQLTFKLNDPAQIDAYFASGIARSVASGRVSYVLGIQGPNLSIDTACSSSLVAVHAACLHLRSKECRMAIAGGVNIVLSPEITMAFSRAHMMARDGRCKAFDERADGFVRGEGCGLVVLKRLPDALADGDSVLAVIRGSAVNQDGHTSGLTVPNGPAQEAVIRAALERAGLQPGEIDYVEAHGTGTALGDPIEAHALAAALGTGRSAPLLIGSVKANVGHLEAAAGVAGLIKVILAMQHDAIPSQLHFKRLNPHIDWSGAAIEIPVSNRAWPRGARPRRAGVSSLGFSGTNAHVIVEESPEPARRSGMPRSVHFLPLSARTESALSQLERRYAAVLESGGSDVVDLCYTAAVGRAHFAVRAAYVAASAKELERKLREAAAMAVGRTPARGEAKVAFLFTGQGAQYGGMGRELYTSEPAFRRVIDECEAYDLLYGADAEARLDDTRYAQPALFALQCALAALWKSWGVEPRAVLGHSVGEYAAACVAGACTMAEGLRLITARGRLMGGLPSGGAMAAVLAPEDQVRAALQEDIAIAAVNGQSNTVVSGPVASVERLCNVFEERGVCVQRLRVSHAFHSPLMEPMAKELEEIAATIKFVAPQIRFISSVTGRPAAAAELCQPVYWRRQALDTVRFGEALLQLSGIEGFLEIGPGSTLLGLGRDAFANDTTSVWAPSIRQRHTDTAQMTESLAALYARGVDVDWEAYASGRGGRKVALPTYPFERRRHWIDVKTNRPGRRMPEQSLWHPVLGERVDLARGGALWRSEVSIADHPWLGDHCIHGQVLFPMTAFLVMMATAAGGALSDIVIVEPLVVGEVGVAVQIVVDVDRIEFHSRHAGGWMLHATARTAPARSQSANQQTSLAMSADWPDPGTQNAAFATIADLGSFYDDLRRRGHEFGPAFQAIESLRSRDGEARAEVRSSRADGFSMHPATLDACVQGLAALLPAGTDSYLPVGLGRFEITGESQERVRSRVLLRSQSSDVLEAEITVHDCSGKSLAYFEGLELRRVNRPDIFFQTTWSVQSELESAAVVGAAIEKNVPVSDSQSVFAGAWLVVPDQSGAAERLGAALRSKGGVPIIGEANHALLASRRWRGVIHLAALDVPDFDRLTADSLVATERALCESLLGTVQCLAALGLESPPRLCIVTCGSQAVESIPVSSVAGAMLWGLGRTIARELPELRCLCVDIDDRDAIDIVSADLLSADSEVAWRAGKRSTPILKATSLPDSGRLRLGVQTRGLLENLQINAARRRRPGPGQVEIEVQFAAVSFRDVLNVLGMYPGDPGPLGSECVGVVAAVGPGVNDLQPGDAVVALGPGAHDGYMVADSSLVAHRPAALDPEQAATMPVPFITALYTLEHLAKIRRGDRVLIHAAAGGVGLAALQVAKRAGAEIFATAGSDAKRAYLRSLGVRHVYDSRSAEFADQIGSHVDIVLNSLAGNSIRASFSVLAPGGCFLEIGKNNIWTAEEVEALGKGIRYHVVDWSEELPHNSMLIGGMLRRVLEDAASAMLKPPPCTVFPFCEASSAYHYMARAQQIGRVVLRQPGLIMRNNRTYLVTGGLGGLGLETARWLAARGARHLALAGRRAPTPEQRLVISELEEKGAHVVVAQVDVSDRPRLEEFLQCIDPPLAGIVHAAGTLSDAVLIRQDWTHFAPVFRAKVEGAWNLHELTESSSLDFFVLFSSIASVLGAPGQANHAAANAFEDALAHARRGRGLPAITINWGPWTGTGAADHQQLEHRHRSMGLTPFSIGEGVSVLERILDGNPVQIAAARVNWHVYAGRAVHQSDGASRRGAREVRPTLPARPALADILAAAPAASRVRALEHYLHELAVHVLRFPAGRRIDPRQPLQELGLDSLMAVEFRNALSAAIGRPLPVTLLFSYPALEDLMRTVAAELIAGPAPKASAERDANGVAGFLDAITELSDDEVERLYREKVGGPR